MQATRGYDEVSGETFYLRSKAEAPDYRYMPDPELGEVLVSDVGPPLIRLWLGTDLTPRLSWLLCSQRCPSCQTTSLTGSSLNTRSHRATLAF